MKRSVSHCKNNTFHATRKNNTKPKGYSNINQKSERGEKVTEFFEKIRLYIIFHVKTKPIQPKEPKAETKTPAAQQGNLQQQTTTIEPKNTRVSPPKDERRSISIIVDPRWIAGASTKIYRVKFLSDPVQDKNPKSQHLTYQRGKKSICRGKGSS